MNSARTWGGFTKLIAIPRASCSFSVTSSLLPELLCRTVKFICAGELAAQWCYKFSTSVSQGKCSPAKLASCCMGHSEIP